MNAFWDHIATVHRNVRVIAMGAGFLIILAWGAYQMRSATLVDTTRATAVVTDIQPYTLGKSSTGGKLSSKSTFYRGRLMFEDSTWVEMPLVRPLPQVGDRLPVIIEHYDNGSKHYCIDWLAWRKGAG